MKNTPVAFLRTIKGLTQGQLADMAGISRVSLSRIENGIMLRDLQKIDSLAAALGATRGQILAEEPIPGYTPPPPTGQPASLVQEGHEPSTDRAARQSPQMPLLVTAKVLEYIHKAMASSGVEHAQDPEVRPLPASGGEPYLEHIGSCLANALVDAIIASVKHGEIGNTQDGSGGATQAKLSPAATN